MRCRRGSSGTDNLSRTPSRKAAGIPQVSGSVVPPDGDSRKAGEHLWWEDTLDTITDIARDPWYREVVEFASEGFVRAAVNGDVVRLNGAAARLFGYVDADDLMSEGPSARSFYEDPSERDALIERLRDEPRLEGIELRFRRKSGEAFWGQGNVRAITGEGGVLTALDWSLVDVTGRRTAQQELDDTIGLLRATDSHRRRLLGQLVAAQEAERARIAHDLHDGVVQGMTAVGLRLGTLADRAEESEVRSSLREIAASVSTLIGRMRQDLVELRAEMLDEGLGPALRAYVARAEENSSVAHSVDLRVIEEPDPSVRVVIFRVIQEALANAQRHSGARTIRVEVRCRPDGCLARVIDDGNGFDTEDTDPHNGHIGLVAMRERAAAVGGSLTVISRPGEGTTVECFVPASPPDQGGTSVARI